VWGVLCGAWCVGVMGRDVWGVVCRAFVIRRIHNIQSPGGQYLSPLHGPPCTDHRCTEIAQELHQQHVAGWAAREPTKTIIATIAAKSDHHPSGGATPPKRWCDTNQAVVRHHPSGGATPPKRWCDTIDRLLCFAVVCVAALTRKRSKSAPRTWLHGCMAAWLHGCMVAWLQLPVSTPLQRSHKCAHTSSN
jgi:hypothetical protein